MNHESVNLLTDRQLLIGMTLSECHTSVIALCMHVYACLLHYAAYLKVAGTCYPNMVHVIPLSTLKSAGRAWQNDFCPCLHQSHTTFGLCTLSMCLYCFHLGFCVMNTIIIKFMCTPLYQQHCIQLEKAKLQ